MPDAGPIKAGSETSVVPPPIEPLYMAVPPENRKVTPQPDYRNRVDRGGCSKFAKIERHCSREGRGAPARAVSRTKKRLSFPLKLSAICYSNRRRIAVRRRTVIMQNLQRTNKLSLVKPWGISKVSEADSVTGIIGGGG